MLGPEQDVETEVDAFQKRRRLAGNFVEVKGIELGNVGFRLCGG